MSDDGLTDPSNVLKEFERLIGEIASHEQTLERMDEEKKLLPEHVEARRTLRKRLADLYRQFDAKTPPKRSALGSGAGRPIRRR